MSKVAGHPGIHGFMTKGDESRERPVFIIGNDGNNLLAGGKGGDYIEGGGGNDKIEP